MNRDFKRGERYFPSLIFLGALIILSLLLWYMRTKGLIRIDDAYITFRYSENLARGLGFVYNQGERVLGTTTALFCLLLAGLRLLGIPVPLGADLVNLFSSALSASLIFKIGRDAQSKTLGLMVVFFYLFIPHFWINMATGMETMFTILLSLLLIRMDQKERPVLAGLCASALLLTRLDGLALVTAVWLVRFFKKPRQALICGGVLILTQLPWLIFCLFYFGSVVPQSIFAKRLIHGLPPWMVLAKYVQWFLGLTIQTGRLQINWPLPIFTLLAVLGTIRALLRERWALVFPLWIIFSIGGMVPASATPFFWYKIPMLTGYIFLSVLGIQALLGLVRGWNKFIEPVLNFIIPIGLVLWSLSYYSSDFFQSYTAKERVNLKLAKMIEQRAKPGAKVLVGETGAVGYELLDDYIIDSSGLVSKRVYQIRLEDRERLLRKSPEYRWDWYGTIGWMKQILKEYDPDFIISDRRYIYLWALLQDPEFNAHYQIIASESTGKEEIIALEKRTDK